MKAVLILGFLLVFTGCATSPNPDDKYLWLEEIESKESLAWVKKESEATKKTLSESKAFKASYGRILKTLESKDKLLFVSRRGDYVYNFWKDAKNQRGLWRRAPFADYITRKKLKWETLLDVDELSVKEEKKWVFKGVSFSPNNPDLVLLSLSDGGKDASYMREYSLKEKAFTQNGFDLPESKYSAEYVGDNEILIASNLDKKKLTRSGYPRQLKLLKRGQSFDEAKVLLEIPKKHTAIWLYKPKSLAYKNAVVVEDAIEFFNSNKYLYYKGELLKIPVHQDTSFEVAYKDQYIFSLKKNIKIEGEDFNSGDLIFLSLNEENKFSKPKLFYRPTQGESLKSLSAAKDFLVMVLQSNVQRRAYQMSLKNGRYVKKPMRLKGEVALMDSDTKSNQVILSNYDFLNPKRAISYDLDTARYKTLQITKRFFNPNSYTYKQEWATSADGTKIPFFIVQKKSLKLNGKNPTIMYGYGGFEISLNPFYLRLRVNEWVKKGGVFVLANIRGGGEFGPSWHQAAQKFNKKKSYEDFAAIAKKLFDLNYTSSQHLGIVGGSNGGLLVGASSVLYPNLYKAAFCAVPLLDMLRYDQLLVGSSWIPEYGDPKIKKERDYIKTYSPFQNLKEESLYPEIFFYTSTYDDRVHPGHARKMYQKMKDMSYKARYYENSEGGHAGASNLKQRALQDALKFSFFWEVLN